MLMLLLVVHLSLSKRDSCTVVVLTCFVICVGFVMCVCVLVMHVLVFSVFLYCFVCVYSYLLLV
jgi:hypothetical protein